MWGISNALAISALSVEDGMAGKAVSKDRASTETHAVFANDAMRIMLIGRGYLPNREDYPREALAAALPVLYREQTGHPRKERRLNLLLRFRHGPPPCEPDDVQSGGTRSSNTRLVVLRARRRDRDGHKHPRRHQPICVEAIKEHQRERPDCRITTASGLRSSTLSPDRHGRAPLPRVPPRMKRVTRR